MELKAVFFDLDDTLYGDFAACDAYAVEQVGRYGVAQFGLPPTTLSETFSFVRRKLARAQVGMPPIHDRTVVAQMALEQLGLPAIRHANVIFRVYWDAVMEKMQLRDGVPELLQELRARHIKTAVCTDMLAGIQMEKLERLGLDEAVDFMVSSEEAGQDKPAPPIFWLALQKCGCLPGEAIMVGDNFRHDIQGAMDCGIRGIWLNWNHQERPQDTRQTMEAADFAAVTALLRNPIVNKGETK